MTVEQKEHVKFMWIVPLPARSAVRTFELTFLVSDGLIADVTSSDSGHGQGVAR
jgi:hypothetical protein